MKNISFTKAALAAVFAFATSLTGYAQSVLDNLTFEAPQKLVTAKGNSANLRQTPTTNGTKIGAIKGGTSFAVLEENAQWVKVNTPGWFFNDDKYCYGDGWVSKTVAREVEAKPITDEMQNRFFGWCWSYDLWHEWMVSSPVGSHGLALMYTQGSEGTWLYLGKRVGEVFVFKYCVPFQVVRSDEPKKRILNTDRFNNEIQYVLTVGDNYIKETAHGNLGGEDIDLTKFSDKLIEAIFGTVIRSQDVKYIYINADQLSGEYAEYEVG